MATRSRFKRGDVILHPRSEAFYEVEKVVPGKKLYHLRKMMPYFHRVIRGVQETDGSFYQVTGGEDGPQESS